MNIWETNKLLLFLIFFIPGFISLKVYDLLIPGERRDFSSSLTEVLGYSSLNYAAFSWLIFLVYSKNMYQKHIICFLIILILVLFIAPAVWPFIFVILFQKWKFLSKFIIHPVPKAWDYIFGKRKSFWVIVHLKDGRKIGGKYDTNSFASSFPAEEQIYLEEVWKLDNNGKFIKPVERSKGILILGKEISMIEFFK